MKNKFGIIYNDNSNRILDNSIDRYYVNDNYIIMARIIDSISYPYSNSGIKLIKRIKT